MYVLKGGSFLPCWGHQSLPPSLLCWNLARVLSLSLQLRISSELLSGCKTCPVGEDRHFFPSNAFVFHARLPLGKHLCKLKCVGSRDQNA